MAGGVEGTALSSSFAPLSFAQTFHRRREHRLRMTDEDDGRALSVTRRMDGAQGGAAGDDVKTNWRTWYPQP